MRKQLLIICLVLLLALLSGCGSAESAMQSEDTVDTIQVPHDESISIGEIEALLNYYYDEIDKLIKETKAELLSTNIIDSPQMISTLDSLDGRIDNLEASINSLVEMLSQIKSLQSKLDMLSGHTNESAHNQEVLAAEVKALKSVIDSLLWMQEDEMISTAARLDILTNELTKLQDQLAALEQKSSSLETLLAAYLEDAANVKTASDTDLDAPSQRDTSNQDVQDSGEQGGKGEEKTSDPTEICFETIADFGDTAINSSIVAGQSKYYRIMLYSSCFEFDLAEYVCEPTVSFYQDEQLSSPIELVDNCLPEPFDGWVYFVITSEFDDNIVFYLREVVD